MEAMDSSSIESKQSKPVGSNRINPGQISRLGCQLCAVISFETVASQRAHFQSEWHIYNMSIKRQGTLGGPVTLEQFTSNTQQSPQSNGSEESEDESDLSFYEKSSIDGQSDDGGRVISIGSQFQYFQSQKDHCRFKVYRVLLRSGSDPVDMLRELQICNSSSEQCYWMILMLSGGHFAGAVFDNRMDGKMLVHNTIHRYVTRRKQVCQNFIGHRLSVQNHAHEFRVVASQRRISKVGCRKVLAQRFDATIRSSWNKYDDISIRDN